MKKRIRKSEEGVALLMALLALMVLSGIAVGLVYMTNTETLVNSNYRSEQVSYFAAKAGLEEARDRMMLGLPGGYYFANMAPNPLPTVVPAGGNNGVLYIVNEGNQPGSVQPWLAGSTYMDDELCHDGYALPGLTNVPSPDVHCTQTPLGAGWYTATTSQLPYAGSTAALPFKWVRVAMKLNGSVQNYLVNSSLPASQPVCWNNATEVVLPVGTANCAAMLSPATPVYLITSLAVSQAAGSANGSRKLVQAEVAMNPSANFPAGMFGTGNGCGDISFTGNATTDSFDGSKGPYGPNNSSNTGGDVGSNGNVSISGNNATIGGSLGVLPVNGSIAPGPCQTSNYSISTPNNTGIANVPGDGVVALGAPVNFTAPAPPVPTPPTASYTPPSCGGKGNTGLCLVPGTYGSINLSGQTQLTLAPGVYNINSLVLSGQASVVITPLGQVVLNISGGCPAPCSNPGPVLDLSGQSVNNLTLNANQFQINYGGTGAINITGNASTSYFVLNAPLAPVQISGNGAIFGAVVGNTIADVGNGAFHYDKSVKLAPPSSGALQLISFRHIAY
jgi:hypothetical protein